MNFAPFQPTPPSSYTSEDVLELLSSSKPISATQPDDNFIDILDFVVNQTEKQQTRSGIFSFTIHVAGTYLFPLTHLIFFITLVFTLPLRLIFKRESAFERILREAEMAHQGLYNSPKRSFFSSTDKQHLLRLFDVAGYTQKRDTGKLTEDSKKSLRELDYILWQEDLPMYLDRTQRYDCMPGDPVDRLFAALPSVTEDDWGFKEPSTAAEHDRRVVLALWPYANSSLEGILANTQDPNAHDYWWAIRFAFSIWERSDLSVRCAFTQLLGQLAVAHVAPIDNDSIDVVQGHKCCIDEEDKPCPGEAYVNRNDWLKYARWIHRGRRDSDADLKNRQDQKCASEMSEALHVNKCVKCGIERGAPDAPPKKRMFYCSGCYVSWYPYLRRMYCSKKCQKEDWPSHFPNCQRRKHFLRAVFILKGIASKFMASTYSGFAVDCVGVELRRGGSKRDKVDRSGVPRTAVSPGAYAAGHWIGHQVFPLGQSFLSHKPTVDVRKVLAWDAGNNIYYHLQPIIELIIGPHCDMIVETEVFIRNAKNISALASDTCREGLQIQITKGKDPMFWPHPVLNCRLKGSDPDDIYIIDLLGDKFGFTDIVLPFASFIKSRHASCISSTVMKDMAPHWYPPSQMGLITCRDTVSFTWAECIKTYFAKYSPKLKGPWQVARLREHKWNEKARDIMTISDVIFKDITDRIRRQDIYRQYLVLDPNPYSHEFGIGVTSIQDECDLYKNIWMDRRTYDIIIKDDLVEQHKKLPSGSETLRLTALWTDRLTKHGQRAPFDSVKLLGRRAAKHFCICTSHSADEYREMETAWLMYSGIPAADIEVFYKQCERMFGDLMRTGPVSPELFRNLMLPEGAFECMKHMSLEDAKIFMAIGAYITTPNVSEFMARIQGQVTKKLDSKK
ncbi:mynd finger [Colletotrichum incanum]|uniref:Mynd finger n=1 Tax=Colletotrichum incanum TaxID=1573173 RepID=A0A162N8R9_COLIC|nr:mynd finger [Colletotrichum incanum]OHW99451.1 MYND finger family protein [Colletotrichum incanum]